MTEVIQTASACETSISEYYASMGVFPKAGGGKCSSKESLNAAPPTVADDSGVIKVLAAGNLNAQLTKNASGTETTILPKYLPARCRETI